MSDTADEMEFLATAYIDDYMDYANKDYWVTINGVKIEPEEMNTSHIKNCVAMCERRRNTDC